MKIEEAIKQINDIGSLGIEVFTDKELMSLDMAIEALEMVKAGVVPKKFHDRAMEIQYERLRAPQRWIPVSERLPKKEDADDMGLVICAWQDGFIETFHVNSIEWWNSKKDKSKITHWMRLPEPPGGE